MKSQFQDIIPPEKRSIRNVPIITNPENVPEALLRTESIVSREKKAEQESNFVAAKITREKTEGTVSRSESLVFTGNTGTGILSKIVLWFLTLASVAGLFFVATHYFTTADISVKTKKYSIDLPKSLDVSLSPTDGEVGYSVVTFSDSLQSEVDATGEKEVKEFAKGSIVVYNKYDSNTQRFTEGTRFETPTGLIYKITKSVVVPGIKKIAGKDTPGSIQVDVVAEKPGADYNIDLTDFTVPGLKNDPRFDSFYARSKTKMTGGSVGKIAEVSKENTEKIVIELKEKLSKKLKERLGKELPKNQIQFDGLSTLDYKVPDPKLNKGKAVIMVDATIKAYVLESNSFAKSLLKNDSAEVKVSDEFIVNIDKAEAHISEVASTTTPMFNFNGSVGIEYVFDQNKFKADILGLNETSLKTVAEKYSAIKSIDFSIKPFWKKTLPSEVSKLNLKVE